MLQPHQDPAIRERYAESHQTAFEPLTNPFVAALEARSRGRDGAPFARQLV